MESNISHPEKDEPLVSVIVPCYNSERTIRDCLSAILGQRTRVKYDCIVVDSSTDHTPEVVRIEFPSVRLIHLDERTYAGAARNIGARAARGRYCLMIDSDCVAAPDVIDKAVARHAESEYAAVGGSLRNGTPRSLSGWLGYLLEFKEFMPTTPERFERSIPTANIAYRREKLERYGYFDEDMWLAEDILFNWKMYQAGERLLFDPTMEVTHLNRTGWGNVLSYQVDLGTFSAIARRRGALPGAFLLRYPFLILLMPFVRTFNAAKWLAAHDRRALLIFALLWPVYLLGSTFWSYGFLLGVVEEAQPGPRPERN